ncbi:hypothetical protein bpSLO_001045 (plasmid) [Borrelia parkeri]|uniref:hypothetical protein n=1 Tax=Borrelia parkeri TaxID=141 RepID=UPI001FF4B296|nr:hypothetical protein [Borrelia parkeri]UPA11200.1 hypothetical protein bpSLO_001045 [Borrelia parkeri]
MRKIIFISLLLFSCDFKKIKKMSIDFKNNESQKTSVKAEKKELQADDPISFNPQLNQPSLEQVQKEKTIKKSDEKQKLPDQNSKSKKDSGDDSAKSGSVPNKPVSSEKLEANKTPSKDLISMVSTPVVESIPKQLESQKQKKSKSNPKLKVSVDNQESFKEYKIQDTNDASANDVMMYEVSLGIKDGKDENITNKSSDYNFNNWKLFFAKFNNGAIFVITNNYTWGTGFRVGHNNYIKDGPQGIGLDLEHKHLSKLKNAMTTTGEVFEATTYDDMENEINIRINKSNSSDYVFLKFEVTNSIENHSDSDNEEEKEFDSFNKIKNFLSGKSFVVKKSDLTRFINIIE